MYNFCLRNKLNKVSLIEALVRSRICLFRCISSLTINGLREPNLLQTNSSFPLHLYESPGMFNLGQICQSVESQLTVINPCLTGVLFSDKARCFSQSERALYANYIIEGNTKVPAVDPFRLNTLR